MDRRTRARARTEITIMAKLNLPQRWQRAAMLFLGLRNRRIREALQKAGFTQADADEGRALWEKVASVKLDKAAGVVDPNIIQRIDAFENYWFPIAGAALARRFPEQYARVFLNLTQTEGLEVIASVGMFLKRVTALAASPDPKDQAANDLLVSRGLDGPKRAEIQALLDAVSTVETDELPAPGPAESNEAFNEADEAAWAWYLEWSTVARTVIKDRRLLRALGFLRPRPGGGEEEVEDEVPAPVPAPPVPAPPAPPAA